MRSSGTTGWSAGSLYLPNLFNQYYIFWLIVLDISSLSSRRRWKSLQCEGGGGGGSWSSSSSFVQLCKIRAHSEVYYSHLSPLHLHPLIYRLLTFLILSIPFLCFFRIINEKSCTANMIQYGGILGAVPPVYISFTDSLSISFLLCFCSSFSFFIILYCFVCWLCLIWYTATGHYLLS